MGYSAITDSTYKALGEDDDVNKDLAGLMSPAPAHSLVGPPPDTAPRHEIAKSTPLTGNLAAAPSQAVAKNRDAGTGYDTGTSNPPDGGNVSSIVSPASMGGIRPAVRPGSAAPTMPGSVSGTSLQPAIPAGNPQQVVPDRLNMQTQQDQQKLSQLQAAPTGGRQINNRWGRIGAQILDTAGSIVAPGVAQYIPGSTLNQQRLIGRQQGVVASDQGQQTQRAALEDTQSQAAQRTATAAKENAMAQSDAPITLTPEQATGINHPELAGLPMAPRTFSAMQVANTRAGAQKEVGADNEDARQAALGMKPTTDASGKKTYTPNEDSPVYQLKQSQTALAQAKAELAAAGNDPKSPAYQLALRKANTASSNAAAANIRANAYALNANVGNLGTDNQGRAVNGINTLNGTPMGTRVAPQAAKAMGNIAKFQDVYSSIDNANAAIDEGAKHGVKFNTAAMAEALSDPKTTSSQWLAGKVNTTLTPQEQNVVITTKALHEQIMAMRGAIGAGGVSDTQANRLIAQLPSATTPDLGYARKQLATVRQQLDRLQVALPGVHGGPAVQPPGAPANPTNPGGVPRGIPLAPASAGGSAGKSAGGFDWSAHPRVNP